VTRATHTEGSLIGRCLVPSHADRTSPTEDIHMPNRPLSIIVIAYNEEKFVSGVLEALALQTTVDFEVIVVDSNSTDGTERVART